jgi:hypothetical protein
MAGFGGDGALAVSAALNGPLGRSGELGRRSLLSPTKRMPASARSQTESSPTVAGTVTPGFGDDNGPATSAQLDQPWGMALDSAGSLYFAESSGCIRKVSNGVITTVAGMVGHGFFGDGGPPTGAEFNFRYWLTRYCPDTAVAKASGIARPTLQDFGDLDVPDCERSVNDRHRDRAVGIRPPQSCPQGA